MKCNCENLTKEKDSYYTYVCDDCGKKYRIREINQTPSVTKNLEEGSMDYSV